MNAQSAKTPTPRESVTITLTPDEQDFLLGILEYINIENSQRSEWFREVAFEYVNFVSRFYKKLQFLLPNIGDACATPAHIPEAPGQGGTNSIELLKEYLLDLGDYASFMPSEKWVNKVRLVVSDAMGQGGNQ
ncbi:MULTISPECIES: hypothetical protein [Methylobacter]